jgi:hypothetical protein
MSFESLVDTVQRLSASSAALAALGAELRLRRDGGAAPLEIRRLLQDIVSGIDPELLDGITPQQGATALAIITSGFHHATELLSNPARAPGWLHQDPDVLQTIGRMSARIVHQINAFAAKTPTLLATLTNQVRFRHRHRGGWLAIEAAQVWPALKVVGIDIWEPSLVLARANIIETGLHERVAVRTRNIVDLDDRETFTIVWCPQPSIGNCHRGDGERVSRPRPRRLAGIRYLCAAARSAWRSVNSTSRCALRWLPLETG